MAIVAMKKLRLFGLQSEERSLVEALFSSQLAEPVAAKPIEGTTVEPNDRERQHAESVMAKIANAVRLIEQNEIRFAGMTKKTEEPYKLTKKGGLFSVRREVTYQEFTDIVAKEEELISEATRVEELAHALRETESALAKSEAKKAQYLLYSKVAEPFSYYTDSKNVVLQIGTVPTYAVKGFLALNEEERPFCGSVVDLGNQAVVFVSYLKEDTDFFAQRLSETGFVRCPYTENKTAADCIQEAEAEQQAYTEERFRLIQSIVALRSFADDMKLLYDYYTVELDKTLAGEDFARTERCFYLEAWVPEPGVEKVTALIDGVTERIVYDFVDPEEGELPPTLTQNGKLVSAFESITNSYSVPLPTERDPNGPMSIFYFLFFGVMLSDAGYGLIMALGCFFLYKFVRMEKGLRSMMLLFCLCGISTIIWGAFFGGWFGIKLDDYAGNAFADFLIMLRQIDPLSQPVPMMILCLALGLVHILFGMGVQAVDLCKRGRVVDAICDIGSWYVVFAGLILIILSLLEGMGYLMNWGIGVALFGVLMLLCTQGRSKPTLFGKIFGGVKSLYGIINYFSDILSYTRLFALGLATGVIGWVMNILAGLVLGNPFTFIFGVLILLVGHAFNMGINVLGAYVHDSRLQYVEFFSKFYTGGGHLFHPLGSQVKYNRINMN
ncbi:MAG: V-type ATP synthase subunit I [Clostridia bacterium]|nr:V-type ATP synthase subunit I [Clostridia bacterium]